MYRSAPAISPDGRTIAFAAAGADGRSQLWVRRLDTLTARALTGTEGAVAPFWSPDSRSIGFFAQGQLKRTDASGGAAQILASVGTLRNRGGSWNPDDIILFSAGVNRLNQVSAAGGAVAQIAKVPIRSFFRAVDTSSSFWPATAGRLSLNFPARKSTLARSTRPI